jgi:tRNA U38,U39,U40 pseudouridine synthase TruA
VVAQNTAPKEAAAGKPPKETNPQTCAGAARLVGRHDFGGFKSNPDRDEPAAEVPSLTADTVGPAAVAAGDEPPPWRRPRPQGTVRELKRVEWVRRGNLLELVVEGDGFLRGMVRALAGSLREVGLGRQPPEWITGLLARPDRTQAGANLPAHGLTLLEVTFPPEPFAGR